MAEDKDKVTLLSMMVGGAGDLSLRNINSTRIRDSRTPERKPVRPLER
jgi:hypothetical protein